MNLDICLAIIAAVTQFLTGYLGWRVTIDPLTPADARKKITYRRIFVFAGLLGVLAVIGGVYRANKEEDNHNQRIGDLNTTIGNQSQEITKLNSMIASQDGQISTLSEEVESLTRDTLNALGQPDMRGMHAYAIRALKPGNNIEMDVVLTNHGTLEGRNCEIYYSILISDQSEAGGVDGGTVTKLVAALKTMVEAGRPLYTVPLIPRNGHFSVSMKGGLPLTPEQVLGLKKGTSTLYVAMVLYYKSSVYYQNPSKRHYYTTFCDYGGNDFSTPSECRDEFTSGNVFGTLDTKR
jgi:uncharacterized coiled-coil protein SlyX